MALMGALPVLLRPSGGRAAENGCELVELEVAPNVDPAWQRAMEELRAALDRELVGAACVAARVRIEPSPLGVLVRARSADGRETERPVREQTALVPVVLGLLATAPPEPSPSTKPTVGEHPDAGATPPTPQATPQATTAASSEAGPHDLPEFPSPPKPKAAPSPVGVAIGLSTGVRVGVPTDVAMWDTELRADVLLHHWMLLALIRYAPLAAVSGIALDTDAYDELGAGFGAGRRWAWAHSTLDLTASPSVVFVSMEKDSPAEVSGERAQLRVGATARYGYALGAGWRFTLTLDTEVAPSSLIMARYANPALPPLPAWTAGFRLGVAASLL
jgi:hypothetical protein